MNVFDVVGRIIAFVIVLTVFYVVSYAWVTTVADDIIKKYFNHREAFRLRMDKTIQELLKDYPQA